MKKNFKMNVCYKLGFIFLIVCAPLLACSLLFSYVFNQVSVGIVFAAIGVVIAFAGIILTMCSKPKKIKPKKTKIPKDVDTDI